MLQNPLSVPPSTILTPKPPFPLKAPFVPNPAGFPLTSHGEQTHLSSRLPHRDYPLAEGNIPASPKTPAREPPCSGCFQFPQLAGSFKANSGKAWI